MPGRIGPRVPLNPCDFIPNVRRKHELVVKDKRQWRIGEGVPIRFDRGDAADVVEQFANEEVKRRVVAASKGCVIDLDWALE